MIGMDDLLKELEAESGYHRIDDPKTGYHHYEWIKFVPEGNSVRVRKRHGYDGEEDMASERFDAQWHCVVPRPLIDKVLSELMIAGHSTLPDVNITETHSGRRAYGVPQDGTTRQYKTTLTVTLRPDLKPIIGLQNPEEIQNAGSL